MEENTEKKGGIPQIPIELVKKAKENDEQAQAEIVDLTYAKAKSLMFYKYFKSDFSYQDEAEELVNYCYGKAFASMSTSLKDDNFSRWFTGILKNASRDFHDKNRIKFKSDEDEDQLDENGNSKEYSLSKTVNFSALDNEDNPTSFQDNVEDETEAFNPERYTNLELIKEGLSDCLSKLPDNQRTAVVMQMNGMSNAEIAEMMDTNENTVKSWISRGKKGIKDMIIDLRKKNASFWSFAPLPAVSWFVKGQLSNMSAVKASDLSTIVAVSERYATTAAKVATAATPIAPRFTKIGTNGQQAVKARYTGGHAKQAVSKATENASASVNHAQTAATTPQPAQQLPPKPTPAGQSANAKAATSAKTTAGAKTGFFSTTTGKFVVIASVVVIGGVGIMGYNMHSSNPQVEQTVEETEDVSAYFDDIGQSGVYQAVMDNLENRAVKQYKTLNDIADNSSTSQLTYSGTDLNFAIKRVVQFHREGKENNGSYYGEYVKGGYIYLGPESGFLLTKIAELTNDGMSSVDFGQDMEAFATACGLPSNAFDHHSYDSTIIESGMLCDGNDAQVAYFER